MFNRLETVSKGLASKVVAAKPKQQRKASIVACELALQTTGINVPIIKESIEQLRRNGKLSQDRIVELNHLVAQFDERYLDVQDEAGDNEALQEDSLRLFRQARAVSALSFAGGEDTLNAAMESIYEASMTFVDCSKFLTIVENAI